MGSLVDGFIPSAFREGKVELRTESQSEGTGEEERTSIEALRGGLELERRVLPGPGNLPLTLRPATSTQRDQRRKPQGRKLHRRERTRDLPGSARTGFSPFLLLAKIDVRLFW